MNRLVDIWHADLNETKRKELYDSNCGFFVAFQAAGQALGPVYGVTLTELLGFRRCVDTVAYISLFLAVMYQVTTK